MTCVVCGAVFSGDNNSEGIPCCGEWFCCDHCWTYHDQFIGHDSDWDDGTWVHPELEGQETA